MVLIIHTTIIMIIKFFLCGLIGLIAEILFTGLKSLLTGSLMLSGYTFLWMFPIYGLAVFLEPIYKLIRCSPWIVRGAIWASIILCMEYLSGWVLELTIGICPWDYSFLSSYTMDGFIRLDYFPVWFAAGLIFEKIINFLNHIQIVYRGAFLPNQNRNTQIIILKDGNDLVTSLLDKGSKNFYLSLQNLIKYFFPKRKPSSKI